MKTQATCKTLVVAAIAVLSACRGQLLAVGSGPESEETGDGGVLTSCAPSDCAAYTLACASGAAPMSTRCEVDTSPEFLARSVCTLVGECPAGDAPSCAWAAAGCSGSDPCSGITGGGGVVSVVVDPPASDGGAATSVVSAYFNHGVDTGGQTLGGCIFDPEGASLLQSGVTGAPAPRPGIVSVTAPGFAVSITPACDGTYAPGTSSRSIAPGDLVAFAWSATAAAGSGDNFPATLPSVPAPHQVTLASTDALAASSPSLSRGADLAVDWTVSGAPLSLEEIAVTITQGLATVTCAFDASAASGVVPADALLLLSAGSATFDVSSRHAAEDGTTGDDLWDLRFVVARTASTPSGLARGALTLQ